MINNNFKSNNSNSVDLIVGLWNLMAPLLEVG